MENNKDRILRFNFLNIIFAFIILIAISGCASTPLMKPSYSSRQTYVDTHPHLNTEIKRAILDGRVIKGMTREDVKASWGEPNSINHSTSSKEWDESWSYKGALFSLIEPSKYVTFKNAIVIEVHVADN